MTKQKQRRVSRKTAMTTVSDVEDDFRNRLLVRRDASATHAEVDSLNAQLQFMSRDYVDFKNEVRAMYRNYDEQKAEHKRVLELCLERLTKLEQVSLK